MHMDRFSIYRGAVLVRKVFCHAGSWQSYSLIKFDYVFSEGGSCWWRVHGIVPSMSLQEHA